MKRRLHKKRLMSRRTLVFSVACLLLMIAASVLLIKSNDSSTVHNQNDAALEPQLQIDEENQETPPDTVQEAPKLTESNTQNTPPASQQQWPVQLTSEQATSLTVVVNKKHKLPSTYVPVLQSVNGGSLRPEAAEQLQALLNAASADGVSLAILSAYRSYATQQSTYDKWVAQDGRAAADRYSARPGHSEHQTGLAVDLGNGTCNLEVCFANTTAGKWLTANASEYGFIVRYPEGKEALTGYQYEPWHLRYVGKDAASKIVASGLTMDQYFGVEAGDYQ